MENSLTIENMAKLAPFIKVMMGDEPTVAVFDTEKNICYIPGKNLDHKVRPGDIIKKGSLTHNVLKSGKRVRTLIGPELYGVSYIGQGAPITDDSGKMIGVLVISIPNTQVVQINDITKNLVDLLGDIAINVSSFTSASEELASSTQTLAGKSEQMLKHVQKTNDILQLINDVSSQTHLLGLNAAIEAARAGTYGRGFNVVAEEIRKLAGRTNSSVSDINNIINTIRNNIVQMSDEITQISAVCQEQAAYSQKIMASINDLEKVSLQLEELSKEIIK